jgi:hypothetical protein
MPTADEISEQTTTAILDRIKSEATVSDKVRALVDAIDWIRSIQVNTDGAEPGRLTRFQQIFATVAVGYFFSAVGQNDLAREFQEIASTLSDLDRGIVRTSAEKRAARAGGPKPQPSNIRRAHAYMAAAVDTMMRAKLPLKVIKGRIDTHAMLYPLIDKKRKKHTKRLSLGDAAEGWREQFNCGEVDNFEAVSTYANCQAMAAAVSDPDAKMNFAERFLQMAVSMMPSINRDSR